jgi:hypothetical protein
MIGSLALAIMLVGSIIYEAIRNRKEKQPVKTPTKMSATKKKPTANTPTKKPVTKKK